MTSEIWLSWREGPCDNAGAAVGRNDALVEGEEVGVEGGFDEVVGDFEIEVFLVPGFELIGVEGPGGGGVGTGGVEPE